MIEKYVSALMKVNQDPLFQRGGFDPEKLRVGLVFFLFTFTLIFSIIGTFFVFLFPTAFLYFEGTLMIGFTLITYYILWTVMF